MNIINTFDSDLTLDPNVNYNILENMLNKLYEQHFSVKTVEYNKYKHKKENWITTGILHSIKLYRKLKRTAPTDADFSILSVNLRGGAGRISWEIFFLMNFELLTFLCR